MYHCRGPTVFKGYLNNPSATEAAFAGKDWLKTGDLALHEQGGYIRVVDRRKDMVTFAVL